MKTLNRDIQNAIDFAIRKHTNQCRKGTSQPYSIHPVSLAMMLIEMDVKSDLVAAALLHDTIEDTDTTYEELTEVFSKSIADLVQSCTENVEGEPWLSRKTATIKKIKKLTEDELHILLVDKIHNLYSMYMQNQNDDVWQYFSRGYEDQKWYYTGLKEEFLKSPLSSSKLMSVYLNYFNLLFGDNI